MGNKCRRCGSYAINPHCHGREAGKHLTLCDVCYWREQYDNLKMNLDLLTKSDKTFNEDQQEELKQWGYLMAKIKTGTLKRL